MKAIRIYTLLVLMMMVFGGEGFGQSQKSPTLEKIVITAKQAYNSADFPAAYASYLALDSVDSIVYYYDLWQFYVSAEKVRDTVKSKELLFRLAENNGFERFSLNQKFLKRLDYETGLIGQSWIHSLALRKAKDVSRSPIP